MQPLRFDGKVVLVTGAGNGLGRSYALAFAQRGASVVVNDLGGDRSGGGNSVKAADKVVFEIKANGGKAVANYDSVEEGEKLVKTALDAFGRIDIVVNNAGILRDKSFARINDTDWDLIHRIHLRGSFMVTRAAWPHMKKQNYGRIIMVSSNAGIYGNFGQANYSAAKLGLVGLSNTLAIEGAKYGISCNTIAPLAGSRLTETVMPQEVLKALKPEYVAPVVLYMCHDSCEDTGGLYEIGAGWVGKLRWERTKGVLMRSSKTAITPEAVRDNWEKISDFTDSNNPQTVQESTGQIIGLVSETEQEEEESKQDANNKGGMDVYSQVKRYTPKTDFTFTYTERDAMLYALGVGVSTRQEDYLKYLFELSEDFTVLPTFAVIPSFPAVEAVAGMEVDGFSIDPTRILHGEQYTELYKPIPRSGVMKSKMRIADVVEKKSGLVLIVNVDTFDAEGEKVFFNQFVTFVVGAEPIGAPKTSGELVPILDTPKRSPDATMTEKTDEDQAALYRLSGDYNPLHIDSAFAAMGGFKTPILHGLCSYGHAVRHVMAKFANNDMTRFKSVKVRFAKPVLPGQSLQTDMWKEGNRIHFITKVVENGNVSISGAYVDLHPSSDVAAEPETSGRLQSDGIFRTMQANLPSRPDLMKKINAIYQWNITDQGKQAAQWIIDLKSGTVPQVYQGELRQGKVDCTITIGDDDFKQLTERKLNAQKAFMTGKIKLRGNMSLAQKLGEIFDVQSSKL